MALIQRHFISSLISFSWTFFFLANFATGIVLGTFIFAYFGVMPFLMHCWLKYMLALQFNNSASVFL